MTEGIESYEALLGEILRAADVMALTGGAGGKFRIDLDYAPQAIADLEKAKIRLQDAFPAADRAGQARPPAKTR